MSPNTSHSQPDASSVARALADRAEEIAVALLGEPTSRSRSEYRWGNKGSLSLCLKGAKRSIWCDFERLEGGDMLDLVARVHGVPLSTAIRIAEHDLLGGRITSPVPVHRRQSPVRAADDTEARSRVWAALRLWSESVSISGTLAERYFIEHRKLAVRSLDLAHALRWHRGKQAVIALMTDPVSGEPIGIHRTFLDADGAKIERKMLGRQGAMGLSPADAVTSGLGVTEGVEDGIAVLLSGWAPVWAATSAGAIARFPVLAGIEALTIFADADAPGTQAADACVARWRAAGHDARITSPVRP